VKTAEVTRAPGPYRAFGVRRQSEAATALWIDLFVPLCGASLFRQYASQQTNPTAVLALPLRCAASLRLAGKEPLFSTGFRPRAVI